MRRTAGAFLKMSHPRERITAIKVHNEMSGDDAVPHPTDNGPSQLDLIKERASNLTFVLVHPKAIALMKKRGLEP